MTKDRSEYMKRYALANVKGTREGKTSDVALIEPRMVLNDYVAEMRRSLGLS